MSHKGRARKIAHFFKHTKPYTHLDGWNLMYNQILNCTQSLSTLDESSCTGSRRFRSTSFMHMTSSLTAWICWRLPLGHSVKAVRGSSAVLRMLRCCRAEAFENAQIASMPLWAGQRQHWSLWAYRHREAVWTIRVSIGQAVDACAHKLPLQDRSQVLTLRRALELKVAGKTAKAGKRLVIGPCPLATTPHRCSSQGR